MIGWETLGSGGVGSRRVDGEDGPVTSGVLQSVGQDAGVGGVGEGVIVLFMFPFLPVFTWEEVVPMVLFDSKECLTEEWLQNGFEDRDMFIVSDRSLMEIHKGLHKWRARKVVSEVYNHLNVSLSRLFNIAPSSLHVQLFVKLSF